MNAPTLILFLIILAIFIAIVGRSFYRRKHRSGGGCGCGCAGCPNSGICHPDHQ